MFRFPNGNSPFGIISDMVNLPDFFTLTHAPSSSSGVSAPRPLPASEQNLHES
jgi:hypothetical protein